MRDRSTKTMIIDMYGFLLFLCLITLPASGGAQQSVREDEKGEVVRKTEKGLFTVSMMVEGKIPVVGVNRLNLLIHKADGAELTGAEITVTPWMPEHGHGVWEKPVVTELGGGRYHVENAVLIMAGRWDMKVDVNTGTESDIAVFPFTVGAGEKAVQEEPGGPAAEYLRTEESYNIPNVSLLNQEGRKIKLRSLLSSGKPVIIDFIFTTCTTICPILSAGFSSIRDELGESASKVQLVSISIDPEHDRPEQMKEYLSRFNSGEGWDFLTGSREDITLVLKAFDAYIADKMSHRPLYILRGPHSDRWVRINGLIGKKDLMREFRGIEHK